MILLDTDTFTHLSHGHETAVARWEEVGRTQPDERIVVSVVTWFEAVRGRMDSIIKAEDEEKLKFAQARFQATWDFLVQFQRIPIDDATAGHFERLRSRRNSKSAAPTC